MIKLFDGDKEIKFTTEDYITKVFPLDNFSSFSVVINDIEFKTGEHAFQYYKYDDCDTDISFQILGANSPYEARKIGRRNKEDRVLNWNKLKYDVMYTIFKNKVEQDEMVRECLLNTKNYEIREYCVDEDTEWGLDKKNKGKNMLGKTWMKVREELINNSK